MNMRDFWAKEAAAMRDTSHLGMGSDNPDLTEELNENVVDSTRLTAEHHKKAWAIFQQTVIGKNFIEYIQKNPLKVWLVLKSGNENIDGSTQVYEGLNSQEKPLFRTDKKIDIRNGVTIVVTNCARSEQNAINTFGHEMFVHVKRDIERLTIILTTLRQGRLKIGSDPYMGLVKAVGHSECPDHKRLALGRVTQYQAFSKEVDKIKSSNSYINMYYLEIKDHERYKNRACND